MDSLLCTIDHRNMLVCISHDIYRNREPTVVHRGQSITGPRPLEKGQSGHHIPQFVC